MNEEQIFLAALRRGASERSDFLADACGPDVALRERVEARLSDEDRSLFNFLNEPNEPRSVSGTLTLPLTGCETRPPLQGDTSDLQSGSVIAGRYKLEALLGEGGMGEVWIAQQEEPVRRRVALKLIKAGLGSRETLARFEQERQALALMDHPSIAKVLDAGLAGEPAALAAGLSAAIHPTAYAAGSPRPFFVMELVEGQPLTRFCDEAKLTINERLELFVPICQAVQHAHQKGIIHRDLKPSNILVTRVDGKPVPKVIDFGVAKAALGKLSGDTLATQFGTLVGTLEYMAPEQASMSGLDVDTRADIYSLGVILYELLAGLRPFDPELLRSLPFDEMLRVLREEEPRRPSVRLAAEPGRSRLAHLRGTDAPRAVAELRGDLDWIILKCLEKDRARRYESANGLARDIQRHLKNEAVEAAPPTAGYRLQKFLKRHRGGVIAASLLFIALLAGVVGTSWALVWALRERDDKETARQLAQDRLVQVEKANDILAAVFRDLDPKAELQGGLALRAQLAEQLSAAANLIDTGLEGSQEHAVTVKHRLGVALRNLDQVKPALAILEDARARREKLLGRDHPDTLDTQYEIAQIYLWQRNSKAALPILEEVLAGRRAKLGPDNPDTLKTLGALAWCTKELGDFAKALPLAEETLERQTKALGREHKDTMDSLGRVAILYMLQGDEARGCKLLEEGFQHSVKEYGPDHYKTLISACNYAWALRENNQADRAATLYEDTLARLNATLGPDHVNTLVCGSSLAEVYRMQSKYEKALPIAENVVTRAIVKVGKDHPQTQVFRNNLALLYEKTGKLDQAITIHRDILAEAASRIGPDHPEAITTKCNLAMCLRWKRQFDESIKLYREALAAARKTYGPTNPETLGLMANFSVALTQAGQGVEAESMVRESLAHQEEKTPPGFGTLRLRGILGGALFAQKRYAEAEPLLREACEGMLPKAKGIGKERLADIMVWLIACYEAMGRPEDAAKWKRELAGLRVAATT